jgi:uncharacterized membrane protein
MAALDGTDRMELNAREAARSETHEPVVSASAMAALAYLLPPLTGLVAYLGGSTPRARFHGLQAILFGVVWPVLLYVVSYVSPVATQVVFVVGVVFWAFSLAVTALGRDLRVPGLRAALERAAWSGPRSGVP